MAVLSSSLDFELPPALEASAPPEERGTGREDVRLLVSHRSSRTIEHRVFAEVPDVLRAGDLLVINRSATLNAALDALVGGVPALLHLSRQLEGRRWIVELRRRAAKGLGSKPWLDASPGAEIQLPGHASALLLAPASPAGDQGAVRLWMADMRLPVDMSTFLAAWGRPIVYGHVTTKRPLAAYQTVFAAEPGSAEMPSAGRPFTTDLVTRLVVGGIGVASVLLHCGVSSLEAREPPQPEPFEVSTHTAQRVNAVLRMGGRVIAVGTTVMRALESAAVARGLVLPASGLTDLVIDAAYSPRAVSGLLTGWHEPRASHLAMLEAVAGKELLHRSYREALDGGYLWHEFGDSHLILP
jgi:S-adenosylmethionine:tRNA ribosyltransferase-isomerase